MMGLKNFWLPGNCRKPARRPGTSLPQVVAGTWRSKKVSSPNSTMSQTPSQWPARQAAKLRRISDGGFSARFAPSLALKDVHLALQAAGDGRLEVLACLAGEWQQAVDQGLGGQDLTR